MNTNKYDTDGSFIRKDSAARIAAEMLLTGTRDYWIDVCQRAIAYGNREEVRCLQQRQVVPKWVGQRRKEYSDVLKALEAS